MKRFSLFLCEQRDDAGALRITLVVASALAGQSIYEHHVAKLMHGLDAMPCGNLVVRQPSIPDGLAHSVVFASMDKHGLHLTPVEASGKRAKMSPPTLEEVRLCCAKAGLPESDAEWFFHKGMSNGWTNAGQKIKSWTHTIAAWKAAGYMPSQKRQHANETHQRTTAPHNGRLTGAEQRQFGIPKSSGPSLAELYADRERRRRESATPADGVATAPPSVASDQSRSAGHE